MEFSLLGIVILVFALIMAMTLHEFAHAWVGHWLGDTTAKNEGRLSINPLVHIDPVMTVLIPLALIVLNSPVIFGAARPVPFNPWAVRYGKWGAAMIAAAGPAMNILLAVIFALAINFSYGVLSQTMLQLFITIISINVAFAVFNMIPIPPLDGSRIAYAALPPIRPLFDQLERNGLIIIFALLLLAGPLIMPAIGGITSQIVGLLVPGLTSLPF